MKKTYQITIIILLFSTAFLIRFYMFPAMNWDMFAFLLPWFTYITTHGGFFALKDAFYNYSPPYLYLMVIAAALLKNLPAIYAIKIISVLFDLAAAWMMFLIIRLKHPNSIYPWVGSFLVLFAPNVFLNSAYWGQCDAIYSLFLLGCIYFICKKRYSLALIFFASGFAFKAQAIFLAPLILVLFLRGCFSWRNIILIPVFYGIWLLPSLIVGYPFVSAISTYFNQAGTYHSLSMNAANLYAFISNDYYSTVVPIGLSLTALITGMIIWITGRSKIDLDSSKIVFLSTFFTVLLPFMMPKMHDRYFYPAALISISLPFFFEKLRLVPLTLQATSVISYTPFLINKWVLPLELAVFLNLALVVVLSVLLMKEFWRYTEFSMKWTNSFIGALYKRSTSD